MHIVTPILGQGIEFDDNISKLGIENKALDKCMEHQTLGHLNQSGATIYLSKQVVKKLLEIVFW